MGFDRDHEEKAREKKALDADYRTQTLERRLMLSVDGRLVDSEIVGNHLIRMGKVRGQSSWNGETNGGGGEQRGDWHPEISGVETPA